MTDDETQQFHARVMTGAEFEARKVSKFTIESVKRTRYNSNKTEGETKMSPPDSSKSIPIKSSDSEKRKAIEDAVARKKAAAIEAAKNGASSPPKGSKAEKLEQATSNGVVKPNKSERKTKIPKELNGGRADDTSTVTEKPTSAKKKSASDVNVEEEADNELDETVKKKKEKPAKDPSMLSVGDVARDLGLDPKRARARLRAAGQSAVEGRWPKVKRGSKEHDALIAALQPEPEPEADTDDAQEEESDEE